MKIYMNNAATSFPKPPCVAEAARASLTELPGAANRGGIEDVSVFDLCRERLGALMKIERTERIALLQNATAGLNLALFGFPFERGDAVVTTLAEHNSVLRPLYELERRGDIKTVFVAPDKSGRVNSGEMERAIEKSGARLCVFTHASNVTGAVNDARAICAYAKKHGAATLLDASQTLGFIDIDAGDIGADMIAFTSHKYLLGPQGSGGLYVGENIELRPTLFGGTGVLSDLDTMPEAYPQHLEAGTGNETSFAGLAAALEWTAANPIDRGGVISRLERLSEGIRDAGARLVEVEGERTPVLSFTCEGMSCADAGFLLEDSYDIICRTGLHCAPKIFAPIGRDGGTVRLSMSRFTSDEEISEVISAVGEIAGESL